MIGKPNRAADWTAENEAAHQAQYPHWSQYNSLDAAMERVMSDIEILAQANMALADLIEKQGERLHELEEVVKKLQGEITAIPFYARKIADLEADNKRLSGLVDELMRAMERARIPRHF